MNQRTNIDESGPLSGENNSPNTRHDSDSLPGSASQPTPPSVLEVVVTPVTWGEIIINYYCFVDNGEVITGDESQ